MADRPPFPGAIAATHLRVYDTEAPDGLAGGTPHLHTACTEAYWVVAGTGAVQTLTAGGYEEVSLEPGAFVWFTPGTIHRLINGGDLEILVLMQNAGLPEAGDMVITFPPEVVASPASYDAVATLPEDDRTTAGRGDAARARRDLAVPTFLELRAATEAGDPQPLRTFHDSAARLVQPHVADWTTRWRDGPLREVEHTGDLLRALTEADPDHLADAGVHRLPPPPGRAPHGLLRHLGHVPPVAQHRCHTCYVRRMTMLSFRVEQGEAERAQEWAKRLGLDRSELLRDALRRHLARLASEDDAVLWVEQPLDEGELALAAIADWGPAEDWSDWADATG